MAYFESLPLEIKLKILNHLDFDSLLAVRLCSRECREIVDHPINWRHRLIEPSKKHVNNTKLWELLARREIQQLYLWKSHAKSSANSYSLIFRHLCHSLRVVHVHAGLHMLLDSYARSYSSIRISRIEEMIFHCGPSYNSGHCIFKALDYFPNIRRLTLVEISSKLFKTFLLSALECKQLNNLEQLKLSGDRIEIISIPLRCDLQYFLSVLPTCKTLFIYGNLHINQPMIKSNSKTALRLIERLYLRLPQQVKFGDFRMYENLRVLAIYINSENELLMLLSGIRLMSRLQSFVLQYNPQEISQPDLVVDIPSDSLDEICFMSNSPREITNLIVARAASVSKLWYDSEFRETNADELLKHWNNLEVLVLSGGISKRKRTKCLDKLASLPKLRLVFEFCPLSAEKYELNLSTKLGSKHKQFNHRTGGPSLFDRFFSAEPSHAFERMLPACLVREFMCMDQA